MDKKDLKQALSHISMPERTQWRIRGNLRLAAENNRPVPKRRRFTPAVAAALALCVVTVSAAAAYTYLFRNPTILGENETAEKGQGKITAYAKPNSPTTFPMERMIADYTFKSKGWTSMDTIHGSFRFHDTWSAMEVTEGEGPLRSRNISSNDGAVKEEFTAEDPALLQEKMKSEFSIDFSGLNRAFSYVPDANLLYTITDKDGSYAGMFCDALYAGPTEGSYFTLEYTYDLDEDNQSSSDTYIKENDYDQAYSYTNAQGLEFVITTYGDCSWAECITAHSTFVLYGGYLSTETMETILEYIGR